MNAQRSPLACDSCPVRDRAACSALSVVEREELAAIGLRDPDLGGAENL